MYNPKPTLTIIPTQCTIAKDYEGHGVVVLVVVVGGGGGEAIIMLLVIDETC